jgi:hypothetical protein
VKQINPNIFPKGGFKYKESDGTTIVGQTWAGVFARVAKYRKRAGLPEGNPEQDVTNQACASNPILCAEDSGERRKQLVRSTLKTRVLKWLMDLRTRNARGQEPISFVETEEMRRRATICSGCSNNQEVGGGCATCKATIKEARRLLLDRKFQDGRLHGCQILGEDLPVSSWLEDVTVENPELPDHCWRKRTL